MTGSIATYGGLSVDFSRLTSDQKAPARAVTDQIFGTAATRWRIVGVERAAAPPPTHVSNAPMIIQITRWRMPQLSHGCPGNWQFPSAGVTT